MPSLELESTHQGVTAAYDGLARFDQIGIQNEGAVCSSLQEILPHCGRQFARELFPECRAKAKAGNQIAVVGGLLDNDNRIAVKVINHLGDEVMKIFPV